MREMKLWLTISPSLAEPAAAVCQPLPNGKHLDPGRANEDRENENFSFGKFLTNKVDHRRIRFLAAGLAPDQCGGRRRRGQQCGQSPRKKAQKVIDSAVAVYQNVLH